MVVTGEPPPGGGPGQGPGGQPHHHLQNQVIPGQTFAGAAQAAGGTVPGGRSWIQIFKDAKEKRNILEVQINKVNSANNSDTTIKNPKALTFDQLSITQSIYFI